MKKLIVLSLMGFLIFGCASIVPKDLENQLSEVMTGSMSDSFVLIFAAGFHKQEGRWPKNSEELQLNMDDMNGDLKSAEVDFDDITFVENADGSLTVEFYPSREDHHKIILTPPSSDQPKYVGTYTPVEGSNVQRSGTMSFDLRSED